MQAISKSVIFNNNCVTGAVKRNCAGSISNSVRLPQKRMEEILQHDYNETDKSCPDLPRTYEQPKSEAI